MSDNTEAIEKKREKSIIYLKKLIKEASIYFKSLQESLKELEK